MANVGDSLNFFDMKKRKKVRAKITEINTIKGGRRQAVGKTEDGRKLFQFV